MLESSDKRHKCVIRTYSMSTLMGSTNYEHDVAKALENDFDVDLWAADPNTPEFLKYKKLRYLYQTLKEQKQGKYLITGGELYACGLNLRCFDKKTLVLYHYGVDDTERKWVQRFINSRILRHIEQFDKIVVIAEFWANFLKNFVDPAKMQVIYCSYPSNMVTNVTRNLDSAEFKKKLGLPLDRPLIYAGAADRKKGVQRVLEKLKGCGYFIYTTGALKTATSAAHFNLMFEDYLRLLSVTDAAIFLPQFQEGWTRAAHESLLCGVPTIGYGSGGLGELLSKTGQIIYQDNDNLDLLVCKAMDQRGKLIENALPFLNQHNQDYFRNAWIHNLKE